MRNELRTLAACLIPKYRHWLFQKRRRKNRRQRKTSNVLHALGHWIKRRMTVHLVICGFEERVLLERAACDDIGGAHYPDAYALIAARVYVARIVHRHLCIRRVQAAHVPVREPRLAADEHFPEWPLVQHATPCAVAIESRRARFCACAASAS